MPLEYVVRWSGGRIGSGATVLHFRPVGGPAGAQALADETAQLFGQLTSNFPSGVQFNFDPEVKLLSATGTLEDVYSITPPASVQAVNTSEWANGVGALVRLRTSAVVGGRRLQGRMFLVPLAGNQFTGGNVSNGAIDFINQRLGTWLADLNGAGPGLVVWSRTAGAFSDVTSATVSARPTTLRTRNDYS